GLLRAPALEEGRVGRVSARIAALDIVDAELVEHGRDRDLVLDGEVDAWRLLAVAQRRVEKKDPLSFCHAAPPNRATVFPVCPSSLASRLRADGPRSVVSKRKIRSLFVMLRPRTARRFSRFVRPRSLRGCGRTGRAASCREVRSALFLSCCAPEPRDGFPGLSVLARFAAAGGRAAQRRVEEVDAFLAHGFRGAGAPPCPA